MISIDNASECKVLIISKGLRNNFIWNPIFLFPDVTSHYLAWRLIILIMELLLTW